MSENSSSITADKLVHESLWVSSFNEFKSLRVVIFCGMMCSVAVILSYVASFNIGNYIKIGISGIPNQIVAYLFGPAIGGIFGGVLDIVKFIVKPDGAFFPGFTISAILGGVIYGRLLYKKPVSFLRIFLTMLLIKVVVNIGLNTLWLMMLYGYGLFAILPARIISNAVMLPIDSTICFIILKAAEKSIKPLFMNK